MKIGIITVHDSANFGSFLQAYSLKVALEMLGHEVKFVKTRSRLKLLKVYLGNIRYFSKYAKNFKYNMDKYKIFMDNLKGVNEIDLKDVSKNTIDVCVIGSDELWNVLTPVFKNEYFYGGNIDVNKKIAYAISSGDATSKDFLRYPNLIENIEKLDTILVRDSNTKDLVKELIGRDCIEVCDPTFLIAVKKLKSEKEIKINDEYILIYSYNLNKEKVDNIIKFAKENNLKTVAVCMKHKWCDYNINCSPLEFCNVISNAKYVVTSTFHGTIFSVLNNKQYITYAENKKIKDLLNRLCLKDSAIEDMSDYEELKNKLQNKIDFTRTNEIVLDIRKKSLEKLQNELKGDNV